jgi:rRNA biogenesis protein RRP5
LSSTLPPLASYSSTNIGLPFHGTIVSLTSAGAVVEFYAGARGFLPLSEMSEAFISDARDHFRRGQTVKAWILDVSPEDKKMRLSLKDQSYWSQGGEAAFQNLEEGSIVEASVSAKLVDKIILDIPYGGVQLRGVVYLEHLADTRGTKCEKKLAKLREGTKLKETLVLSKNLQNRIVTCSVKPALIEAANAGSLPSKFEDFSRGRKVVGWVKNIEDFGAFIAFAGSVEGVVYKSVSSS